MTIPYSPSLTSPLEKLNDHFSDRQCLQTEEHFKFGFAMGVLLMKEVYELPDFQNME